MSAVYADYIKQWTVYMFIKETYKDELSEDTNRLREKLSKLKSQKMDGKDEAFKRNYAVELASVDGRIDLCDMKREELKKVTARVNETITHYERLSDLVKDEDKELEEPKKIEE